MLALSLYISNGWGSFSIGGTGEERQQYFESGQIEPKVPIDTKVLFLHCNSVNGQMGNVY